MGQVPSYTKYAKKRKVEIGKELTPNIFSIWPALETQLELSFNSLDLEERGLLSYSTLEPVLRHHLMQIGLIQFIARFTTEDGTLDSRHIHQYLKEYKINLYRELDIIDWKHLMLSWIRCVQDAQEADIVRWQESIEKLEKEQEYEYQNAIKQFQEHYVNHLEEYYQSINSVHQQEVDYRDEWETQLGLQETFHNLQVDFIKQQEQESDRCYQKIYESKDSIEQEYAKQLKSSSTYGPGNIKIITFLYPASITKTGSPVSAGAQVPFRKPICRVQQKGCC